MKKEDIVWLFELFGIEEKDIGNALKTWLRVEAILSILNLRGERHAEEIIKDGRLQLKQIMSPEGE